jgi:hypothetical protein
MAFTPYATNLLKLHFKDSGGNKATSQYHLDPSETDPSAGGALAIANGAAGLSNDALTSSEIIIGATNDAPGSPTDGPYARGADKLLIALRTTSGQDLIIQIGSPNETVLASDNVHIDPTNASVIAFVTAMKNHACDESGDSVKGLQRGYRRRPAHRKHA